MCKISDLDDEFKKRCAPSVKRLLKLVDEYSGAVTLDADGDGESYTATFVDSATKTEIEVGFWEKCVARCFLQMTTDFQTLVFQTVQTCWRL